MAESQKTLRTIKLSVQEFAQPSPRTGHIDRGNVAATSEQGILLHQQIQKKRLKDHAHYRSEVKIGHTLQAKNLEFKIEGRMDGLFESESPLIEEIKSSFDVTALASKIREQGLSHPYVLQLMTYGFFYQQRFGVLPALRLHLASVRSRQSQNITLSFEAADYESWLNRRLEDLVHEVRLAEARVQRRKRLASSLQFPFPTARPGQVELIDTIEKTLSLGKNLLLQAPTGLGKTVGVLFPTLKSALARGQSVFYATPKNSQHLVAEEALEGFRAQGAKLKNLTLTAKTKLCLKEEVFCRPDYCEFACNYHDKVHEKGLKDLLRAKRKLTPKTFKRLGEEHGVCPYALQWEVVEEADVVIGDYNHVFSPHSAFAELELLNLDMQGKPELVIDEAHNLPSRSMDYYSPRLSIQAFTALRPQLENLSAKFSQEANGFIDEATGLIQSYRETTNPKDHTVNLDPAAFNDLDGRLRTFLTQYLESDVEILPRDPIMAMSFMLTSFAELLGEIHSEERSEFFASYQHSHGGSLKLTCCDASQMLRPIYQRFEHTVAFSATLKPFDYYAALTGLSGDTLVTAEFSSPFDPRHRKLLIIPQISTKYSTRHQHYGKIADTIQRISSLKTGNYLAFFPSFAFMEEVLRIFVPPAGIRAWRQERGLSNAKVEDMLAELRSNLHPTILFAVQGGVFSEGVDYPGSMVIGAFVIGPALPTFDVEREEMKQYYQEHYRAGFNYAYAYPAMAKVVQAAGRVIRREDDYGVIILMDDRFVEKTYSASMPVDWFSDSPQELVSSKILADVSDFWNQQPL